MVLSSLSHTSEEICVTARATRYYTTCRIDVQDVRLSLATPTDPGGHSPGLA